MKRLLLALTILALAPSVQAKGRSKKFDAWPTQTVDSTRIVRPAVSNNATRIEFWDGDKYVGALDWSTGTAVFTGHADKSARIFFDSAIKGLIQPALDAQKEGSK